MTYMANGERIQESCHTKDRRLAQQMFEMRKAEVFKGTWLPDTKKMRTPLHEVIKQYMEVYSKPTKISWKEDERILKRFRLAMEAELGAGVTIQEITKLHIELFKARLKNEECSEARINRHLASARTFFNHAIEWKKISVNPVRGIKFYKELPRTRYLETGDIKTLLAACSPRIHPIVFTAILTGLRQGDILKLKWNDLDFPNRKVSIIQSKTKIALAFQMSETLAKLLESLPRLCSYVFSENGKPLTGYGWVRTDFQSALKEAGISKFQFRDLRRTFGTLQCLQGSNLKLVAELMGHTSTRMAELYVQIPQQSKKEAVDKLGESLSGPPLQRKATVIAKTRHDKPLLT